MATKQTQLKKQAYASNLKNRALSVLIYLIDRSNKDLTCFPSIPTMAEQLHISISTVKRALTELIEAGYIEKTARFREKNRGQRSNLYTLIFVTQTSVFDDENTSAEADRIYIQSYAAQGPSANYSIEHITFETLSAEAHTAPTYIASATCTPCSPTHMPALQRKTTTRTITSPIGNFLSQRWTGAESILQPP